MKLNIYIFVLIYIFIKNVAFSQPILLASSKTNLNLSGTKNRQESENNLSSYHGNDSICFINHLISKRYLSNISMVDSSSGRAMAFEKYNIIFETLDETENHIVKCLLSTSLKLSPQLTSKDSNYYNNLIINSEREILNMSPKLFNDSSLEANMKKDFNSSNTTFDNNELQLIVHTHGNYFNTISISAQYWQAYFLISIVCIRSDP